jgi:membrane protein
MVLEPYKRVFAKAFKWFGEDQVPRLAAAFTFYAMLSLAPMLLIAVATAGFILGESAAQTNIIEQVRSSMGTAQAAFVETLLQSHNSSAGVVAAVFSLAVLFFGASGLFEQLRDSVNAIWGLTSPQGGIIQVVKRKAFALVSVLLVMIGLLGWMILDARLQWLSHQTVSAVMPLWKALSFLLSWAFGSLAFAALFKWMPRKNIQWADVWFAAITTALAFAFGRYLLSMYFALASVSAAYGAAGALVVILLWIYYSSHIMFFGVELSNAYAHECGSLKDQPHDAEAQLTQTGQITTKDDRISSGKTQEVEGVHAPEIPAPTLTNSMATLGKSMGDLARSFQDLGKSFKGARRNNAGN